MATTPPTPVAPNTYQLRSSGKLQISYSTTGIDGKNHLHYQDQHQSLNFSGDEIRVAKSELGTLLTVSIMRTVDTGYTSFTVLVPAVNLNGPTHDTITTYGITTVHRRSPIPAFNYGQLDTFTVVTLKGTAAHVVY